MVYEKIEHVPKEFKREGAEKFPLMVVLSACNVCNAACTHCVHTNFPSTRERVMHVKYLPKELFIKIADQCAEYNAKIRISGKGEPLMHPDMVDMIEYATKKGVWVGLITNGSLLTKEVSDRLLEMEMGAIEISVDAADPETYSKIRRGLDFNTMLENIKYALERRKQLKSKTFIMVSVIDQIAVRDKLEDIVNFWKKLVDHVIVRKYLIYGKLNPEGLGDPYLANKEPCPFPFERLVIETTGHIPICGYDLDGKYMIGNAWDTPITEIWTGKELTELREKLLKTKWQEIPICSTCTDWAYRSWNFNYFHSINKAQEKFIKEFEDYLK